LPGQTVVVAKPGHASSSSGAELFRELFFSLFGTFVKVNAVNAISQTMTATSSLALRTARVAVQVKLMA